MRLIGNIIKQRALICENLKLNEQALEFPRLDEVISESPTMREVFNLIEIVSKTDATVMIHGEDGTEKELIARAIHSKSERRHFPILTVNCAAVSANVLQLELFGYQREARTGTRYYRRGKLELAHQGALFLNEVGNIDAKTQGALLRAIETRRLTPVGGDKAVNADFRIICATSRDLDKARNAGAFREDLYYRLNAFTVLIPPLRERKSDIPLLANYFAEKHLRAMAKPLASFSPEAMKVMLRYDWPGNVRELENAIERALIVCTTPTIQIEDLPYQLSLETQASSARSLASKKRMHIASILAQNNWNISRSAEVLEIDRVTLYNQIQRYRIKRP